MNLSSLAGEKNDLTVYDLAERLLGSNCNLNDLIVWPPNLFALTGYIFSTTGAYQSVISPLEGNWHPKFEDIRKWLNKKEILDKWLTLSGVKPGEVNQELLNTHYNYIQSLINEGDQIFESAREEYERRISELLDKDENLNAKTRASELAVIKDKLGKDWASFTRINGRNWFFNDNSKLSENTVNVLIKRHGVIGSKLNKSERLKTINLILETVPSPVLLCWAKFLDLSFIINEGNKNVLTKGNPIKYLQCPDHVLNDSNETLLYENGWELTKLLLTLHAIADEACCGWGIRISPEIMPERKITKIQKIAEDRLETYGTLATFNGERGRVLPKRHTPNVGITLRNLSNNLAFLRSSIDVVWKRSGDNSFQRKISGSISDGNKLDKTISVLLLPWPLEIPTGAFTPIAGHDFDEHNKPFDFDPGENRSFNKDLQTVLDYVNKELEFQKQHRGIDSNLDLIILPEASCGDDELTQLEKIVKKNEIGMYIAGVREKASNRQSKNGDNIIDPFGGNAVYSRTTGKLDNKVVFTEEIIDKNDSSYKQYKHHRWRLERNQIRQYALGRSLSENTFWWEAIKMRKRKVIFQTIGDRLTICSLICEDLARQDPIADVIRQIGPSFLVTVLLDGPQLKDRWASRYAGVFSEDPGVAVLALTSFGMVKRWSTSYKNLSRIIALWSDNSGVAREIELARGSKGVLLTLDVSLSFERTADGRVEDYPTSKLGLVDVTQIFVNL